MLLLKEARKIDVELSGIKKFAKEVINAMMQSSQKELKSTLSPRNTKILFNKENLTPGESFVALWGLCSDSFNNFQFDALERELFYSYRGKVMLEKEEKNVAVMVYINKENAGVTVGGEASERFENKTKPWESEENLLTVTLDIPLSEKDADEGLNPDGFRVLRNIRETISHELSHISDYAEDREGYEEDVYIDPFEESFESVQELNDIVYKTQPSEAKARLMEAYNFYNSKENKRFRREYKDSPQTPPQNSSFARCVAYIVRKEVSSYVPENKFNNKPVDYSSSLALSFVIRYLIWWGANESKTFKKLIERSPEYEELVTKRRYQSVKPIHDIFEAIFRELNETYKYRRNYCFKHYLIPALKKKEIFFYYKPAKELYNQIHSVVERGIPEQK